MLRIWSIFNRDHRLVLTVSDEPGVFNFTRIPDGEVEPVECAYATLQCYDVHAEPEVLNHLGRSTDIDEFLDQLRGRGYKVIEGRPQPSKFARL